MSPRAIPMNAAVEEYPRPFQSVDDPYKDKQGYVDKSGRIVIAPKFDDAGFFSEGLAPVWVGKKCGFIDMRGRVVIQMQFDDVGTDLSYPRVGFTEGLAPVKIGGKWEYIDRSGKWVINQRFDRAEGFFLGLAQVWIGDRLGYINHAGTYVWEPTK